jgi:molybdopterin molybdotransferase
MLSFEDARKKVIETVRGLRGNLVKETVELSRACGRVLAQPITADRDYPPFNRSIRDGFAVRADDATPGATLHCIGEIKAGSGFDGAVGKGECVQIMTGAAVPAGADSVVMIEHVSVDGDRVMFSRPTTRGQAIVARGNEARAGQQLLAPGIRLGYAEMALTGQVGAHRVEVFRRPRAAILSTGDEVVDISSRPGPLQVRNGNSVALEALTDLTGGEGELLGNAPDEKKELRRRIESGLEANLLIISGGVSMGKYDLVEMVLGELGTGFIYDSVAIRPGRPAVFGVCRGKPVFGLPGNPVSTMVTFELFVVPALDILSGAEPRPLPSFRARLAHAVNERGELTHFLPARVERSHGEPEVSVLPWQGSGDVVTVAKSNAFLVVSPDKLHWDAGEMGLVLPRRGAL